MTLKLTNVRLSFPQLFVPKSVQDGGEAKYSASFLLDKQTDAEQIDAIKSAMQAVAAEKWGTKIPGSLKRCLHEGTEKSYDGYDSSNMFVSASASIRPTVVDRDRSPLTADDGKPYAGCMVHAVIRLWAQDNQFGKRINAQLQGVQFAGEGEAFGAAPFQADEHFDDLTSDAPAQPRQQQQPSSPRPPEGTYRPVEKPSSYKGELVAKLKGHPDYDKLFKASDIADYFTKAFNCKVSELSEDQAKDALADFDHIIEVISMPF